jgi:zinc/manganese transport system substrate-binding protein
MNALPRLLTTTLLAATVAVAQAKLNVVATLPDFAAIAREIGGDQVKVTSLALGTEDPHFVDARPSFIRVLNQADVLIEGGAELEIGWLPPLVDGARNRRIMKGGTGRVDASQGVKLLEIPAGPISRAQGDIHAAGNPHYSLDPLNGKIIARNLCDCFCRLDKANCATYQRNLKAFNERLDAKTVEWMKLMEPLKGTKLLTFVYLAERFGLTVAGEIEPKPGIEPSPAYISDLIGRMRAAGIKLVVVESNRSRRTPEYVAKEIGAQLLVLPISVEGHPKADNYFSYFDHVIGELRRAAGVGASP